MATDSAFFIAGLVGLLAGYIVGDFQRELRWRRDAKRNLAQAVDRLSPVDRDSDTKPNYVEFVRSGFDNVPVSRTGSNGDGNADGPGWALGSVRDGQARRAAVSRPNHRPGADAPIRGGSARRSAPTAVSAGHDCG